MNASYASMQSDLGFEKRGQHARGSEPEILTEIYQDAVNIAIWETEISTKLESAVKSVMASSYDLQLSEVILIKSAEDQLQKILGVDDTFAELRNDVLELVDMFCCLFGLERTGLRLATLNRAMCPRFHVDHVPCRLLKTYTGIATQWIPHERLDRTKLGVNRHNQPDDCGTIPKRQTSRISSPVTLLCLKVSDGWAMRVRDWFIVPQDLIRVNGGFFLAWTFARNSGLTIGLRQRMKTRLRNHLTNIVDICGNNMRIINPTVMTPTKGKRPEILCQSIA